MHLIFFSNLVIRQIHPFFFMHECNIENDGELKEHFRHNQLILCFYEHLINLRYACVTHFSFYFYFQRKLQMRHIFCQIFYLGKPKTLSKS